MIHIEPEIRIVSDERCQQPRWLKIRSAEFLVSKPRVEGWLPKATREYFQSRNAVSGVIHCPLTQEVLMLRQFRFPVFAETKDLHKAWIYEHVAGLIEPDLTAKQNFIKEALEETGVILVADDVKQVASYYVSPGFVDEQHLIFVAELDEPQIPDVDAGLDEESEAIVAEWQTYDEIRELVKGVKDDSGNLHKIVDGKTLMALIKIGLA